jgi:hypothetical protein
LAVTQTRNLGLADTPMAIGEKLAASVLRHLENA